MVINCVRHLLLSFNGHYNDFVKNEKLILCFFFYLMELFLWFLLIDFDENLKTLFIKIIPFCSALPPQIKLTTKVIRFVCSSIYLFRKFTFNLFAATSIERPMHFNLIPSLFYEITDRMEEQSRPDCHIDKPVSFWIRTNISDGPSIVNSCKICVWSIL